MGFLFSSADTASAQIYVVQINGKGTPVGNGDYILSTTTIQLNPDCTTSPTSKTNDTIAYNANYWGNFQQTGRWYYGGTTTIINMLKAACPNWYFEAPPDYSPTSGKWYQWRVSCSATGNPGSGDGNTGGTSNVWPNLTFYKLPAWPEKMVISTAQGTSTNATSFSTTQTLYVDIAALNNGNATALGGWKAKFYVDDVHVKTWDVSNSLAPNYYFTCPDMAIGPLTAGPHTLKVVLDADQNVVESNGTDNTIERAINVTGTVAVTPNLSFYQPSGWASKVIVSKVTGTNTDNTGLLNTDTLYVDVTPHNSGTATISTPWTVKYYVDNEHFATWDIYTTLGANTIISNLVDKSIGYLPAGSHTLKVVLDANNAISESNESDNEFTRTVTVGGTNGSNLTLGQPPGWPYKILFCSSADSYTDQGDAWFNNQKIYLRGAPRNNGTTTITTDFKFRFHVDGVLIPGWTITQSLAPNNTIFDLHVEAGPLSVGTHVIRVTVDQLNEVSETLETDNTYERTIYVSAVPGQPDLTDAGTYYDVSPTTVDRGENLGLHHDIKNQGTGSSGSCVVKYYLSTNNIISGTDYYLGQESVPFAALPAGGLDRSDASLTTPDTVPYGTYYVGWFIDPDNVIAEANNNNNSGVFPNQVTVAKALPIISLNVTTATTSEGNSTPLEFTFNRAGPSDSELSVNFTVSGTASWDADYDVDADATFTYGTGGYVIFQPGVSTVTFFAYAKADALVESNQTVRLTLASDPAYTIGSPSVATGTIVNVAFPDLQTTSSGATVFSSTVMRGGQIYPGAQVSNVGQAASGAFEVRFYLSTNTDISGSDRYLGSSHFNSLSLTDIATAGSNFTVPDTVPIGSYYLGWIVDFYDDVVEGSEFNNEAYLASPKITVVDPPDIDVQRPAGNSLTDNQTKEVDLGGNHVGSAAAPVTFTVTNSGLGSLTGLSLTKTGANNGDFTIGTAGMPTTLAPGASTTFTVTCTPGALGKRTATIRVYSDDPNENPFDIKVFGTGGFPELLVVDSLTGRIRRLDANTGADMGFFGYGGSMGVNSIETMVFGPDGHLYVAFDPRKVEVFHGQTGQFIKTFAQSPSSFADIYDMGFAPDGRFYLATPREIYRYDSAGALLGTFLTFSSGQTVHGIAVGEDQLIYVSLGGTSTGVLRRYNSSGGFLGDFATGFDGNGPRRPLWGPDGHIYINDLNLGLVRRVNAITGAAATFANPPNIGHACAVFTPSGKLLVADVWDDIIYKHNGLTGAAEGTFITGISGLEMLTRIVTPAPEITVEQPTSTNIESGGGVTFPTLLLGTSTTLNFTVKNQGSANLTGVAISRSGAHAGDFTITASPAATVAGPAGSTTFTVRFAPSGLGDRTATLNIANNDSNENPFVINLTGTAIAPEVEIALEGGAVIPAGGSYNFGSVACGVGSQQNVIIRNTGTAWLNFSMSSSVMGADASQFVLIKLPYTFSPPSLYSLPPGQSVTWPFVFAPTTPGFKTTTLRIITEDADEPNYDITMSGTGFAQKPRVMLSALTDLKFNRVTLNGNVTALGADTTAEFRWWKPGEIGYSAMDPDFSIPAASQSNVAFNVINLEPNTLYHYHLAAVNSVGTSETAEGIFTTPPPAPGEPVSLFGNGMDGPVWALTPEAGGSFLVGGQFTTVGPHARYGLFRLTAAGGLDAFNAGLNGSVYSFLVRRSGQIAVSGGFTSASGQSRPYFAQLDPVTGAPDTFAPALTGPAFAMVERTDGSVFLGGSFTAVNGTARSNMACVAANGTLSSTYNLTTNGVIYTAALQPDGKIVIGGDFTSIGGFTRNYIARLNTDGTVDSAFNPGANAAVFCVAVQTDNKILVGGNFTSVAGSSRSTLARVTSTGAIDAAFMPNPNGGVASIALQADGRMIIGGNFTTVQGLTHNRAACIDSAGAPDAGFVADLDSGVNAVALTAVGRVLLGGNFTYASGALSSRLAVLENSASTGSLTASSLNRVQWMRGGSAPEALETTFDLSTNGGQSWTSLGSGVRGGVGMWERTGLSLPGSGLLRARARVAGGYAQGSTGYVEARAFFGPDISLSHTGGDDIADEANASFPDTNTGFESTHSFTLRNTGNFDLTGIALSFVAHNSSEFTVISAPVTTLVPGAVTSFTVRFVPLESGMRKTFLHIASNDPDENPYDILLTGNGIPVPDITVVNQTTGAPTPAISVTFGEVHPSGWSDREIRLTNNGTASLTGLSASLTGGQAAEFAISGAVPTSLAVGASQTLRVRFTPAAPGQRATTLRLQSNDPDESVYEISLTGNCANVVLNTQAATVSQTEATLSASLLAAPAPQTFSLEYGTAADALTAIPATPASGSGMIAISASTGLTLQPNTKYYYRFVGSYLGVRYTHGPLLSFTTLALPPVVEASTPSLFTGTGLSLYATVYHQGVPTTVTIEYGPTSGYGQFAGAAQVITPGALTGVSVGAPITGLSPNTTLYWRFTATNNGGTVTHTGQGNLVPDVAVGFGNPAVEFTDGTAGADLGNVERYLTTTRTLKIRNTGNILLTGLQVTKTGDPEEEFTFAQPLSASLAPGAETTFTVTFAPKNLGASTAALQIISNDPDEAPFDLAVAGSGVPSTGPPQLLLSPLSGFGQLGQSINLDCVVKGLRPMTFEWHKDGVSVPYATSETLTLPWASFADAGTYTMTARSASGTVTTAPIPVVVVESKQQTVWAKPGTTATFAVKAAGKKLTYVWSGALDNRAAGLKTASLTLRNTRDNDSAAPFACGIYSGSAYIGTVYNYLSLTDEVPVILYGDPMPTAIVGGAYAWNIPFDTSPTRGATAFTATGLAPGLTVNTKTGLISGTPTTTRAAPYEVIVGASNGHGKATPVKFLLTVQPFPANVAGSYVALLARKEIMNDGLGGRFDLTVTALGAFSGKAILGKTTYPFRGQLTVLPNGIPAYGNARVSLPAARKLPPVEFNFQIDAPNNAFLLAPRFIDIESFSPVTGWRQTWSTTANPASAYTGYYTFGLDYSEPFQHVEGCSFGSLTVAKTGTYALAGKSELGESMTTSAFLSPSGEFLLWQNFPTSSRSVSGTARIDAKANLAHADNRFTAAALYHFLSEGGESEPLALVGGAYTPPAKTDPMLGLALVPNNAVVRLGRWELHSVVAPWITVPVTFGVAGKVTLPVLNPAKLILRTTPATGAFSGAFTLVDANPLPLPAQPRQWTRSITFQGIVVPMDDGALRGVGGGVYRALPGDTTPLSKMPQLPGSVQLLPAP